jgi:hypothetical protein
VRYFIGRIIHRDVNICVLAFKRCEGSVHQPNSLLSVDLPSGADSLLELVFCMKLHLEVNRTEDLLRLQFQVEGSILVCPHYFWLILVVARLAVGGFRLLSTGKVLHQGGRRKVGATDWI